MATWIYGPQVSEKNNAYVVGGKTWSELYHDNAIITKNIYGEFNPRYITWLVSSNQYVKKLLVDDAKNALHLCQNILDVLLIHSAFINAFGMVVFAPLDREGTEKNRISEAFAEIYEATKEILEKADTIRIFISPKEFEKLNHKNVIQPKNIVIHLGSKEAVDERYRLKQGGFYHPLTEKMQKCSISLNYDLFANVQNDIYTPLAKVLSCNCSYLKKQSTPLPHEITTIKLQYSVTPEAKPPILIRKVKNTYLSQLFEKTCILFYKPLEIKSSDLQHAVKQNLAILEHKCSAYAIGNLSVFSTPIGTQTPCNVPVFFIVDNTVQVDYSPEPSIEFFTGVLQELKDLGVFVPIANSDRYEIVNTKFDMDKLECYKELPAATKTPELKKEVRDYFFLFVGNILHFAVANNIQLPFKLSLAHVAILFNLIDFSESVQNKLILVSIYLLEKATERFIKGVVDTMENYEFAEPISNKQKVGFFNEFVDFLFDKSFKEHFHFNEQCLKGFMRTKQFDGEEIYPLKRPLPINMGLGKDFVLERILKADMYLSGAQ